MPSVNSIGTFLYLSSLWNGLTIRRVGVDPSLRNVTWNLTASGVISVTEMTGGFGKSLTGFRVVVDIEAVSILSSGCIFLLSLTLFVNLSVFRWIIIIKHECNSHYRLPFQAKPCEEKRKDGAEYVRSASR